MGASRLPFKNLLRKPGRTAALLLLTALLAAAVFGGSLVIGSLRSGLDSLEARLGADIIVLPSSAESKVSFKNILLQGTTGAFYMDASVLDQVRAAQGVEIAAPQTFLASLKADCCAVKVQIIGIDPETDFIVKPWIDESYSHELGDMEVVVGCNVTAGVGETLKIYDQHTHVVARLAETGTGLDTAVYCSLDTMKKLLAAAEAKGVTHQISSDTDDLISAVYVKVKDGWDVGLVNTWLNGHVRKVTAVRARSMFTDVSDSLAGISRAVTGLIGAVWALALIVLLIAFAMMIHERRREFAVLRLLGVSRRGLRAEILAETGLCSLAGALLGVGIAAAGVFPFTTLIETRLGLPYLTPSAVTVLRLASVTLLATLLVGGVAGAWAAARLSRVDPGVALREGE
ncbi:MAG: FtsX-like permease family protein [Clostridia bacterium]|nr:FtsX-like permease family protein [Clostridia bacterium]